MDLNLSDRIRERAYYLWLASGCCAGDAERHWLAAEREVLQSGEAARDTATAVPAPKRGRTKRMSRPSGRATAKAGTALVN